MKKGKIISRVNVINITSIIQVKKYFIQILYEL